VVSFPQVSPPKPCIHLSPPPKASCPTLLILLDLITRTFGEEYRSSSSSLCSFFHSPVTSSLLASNVSLKHPQIKNTGDKINWNYGGCRSTCDWPLEVYKTLCDTVSQNVLLTAPLLKDLSEKTFRSRTVKPFHDLCYTALSLLGLSWLRLKVLFSWVSSLVYFIFSRQRTLAASSNLSAFRYIRYLVRK